MTVPLYGFLEGDTIGLLLLAQEEDSMSELVTKLQSMASVRVAPEKGMELWHDGHVIAADATVEGAKLAPLDVVYVRRAPRREGKLP